MWVIGVKWGRRRGFEEGVVYGSAAGLAFGVGLGAQCLHGRPCGVGGQHGGLPCRVQDFDLLGDGEVFVGDDAVGDPGVHRGHRQVVMAEQGGDGFEAHAAVDGLGGQGVAQLVGVHVTDPGSGGGFLDGLVHAGGWDRAAPFGQ